MIFAVCSNLMISNSFSHQNDCDDETQCGMGRIRSCSASGEPTALNFNPTSSGADIMFDLSNPVCLTVIATSYAAVKGSIAAMCRACGMNSYPSLTPSPVRDAALIVQGGIKATSATGNTCAASVAIASLSMSTALAQLGVTYAIASNVFDNATLCGSNWFSADPNNYAISKPAYKAEIENWVRNNPNATLADKNYRQWYYGGVEYNDNPSGSWYHSGVEYSDNLLGKEAACEDPTGSNVKENGHYPRQKYYFRGSQAANYNCEKYNHLRSPKNIPADKIEDYKKAYQCCLNRSQNYACVVYKTEGASSIDNVNIASNQKINFDPNQNNDGVLCRVGSDCVIKGITFKTSYLDATQSRMICVQSHSLCPYNFTIGKGGTQHCDYFKDGVYNSSTKRFDFITPEDIERATDKDNPTNDCNQKSEIRNADCTFNEKAGKCKNYCQYLTHCVAVGSTTYEYRSNLESPYFSSACFNFVGDSRNITAFDGGIIIGSQRHFSAPIAQCVKETMENVFYDRAGHSKCADPNEFPQADGTCLTSRYIQSGDFTYMKGNRVMGISFFQNLQNTLQFTIRMVMSISVMFYGMKILIATAAPKKNEIIMYLIKMGLVMFFATGDAWQSFFFEGVYYAPTFFSELVFDVENNLPEEKKDGCQFDEESLGVERAYPAGKSYLQIWDALDCKTARYLGFAPEASVANIAMLIFAGLFTGPYGIYFVVGLMFFGFFLLMLTIRALHIFLASSVAIIIMVYISPIIIPTVLFSKTASIFKNWLTNLISFCFQPMILAAYIGMFIIIFDSTMIGSATFKGSIPNKTINCDEVCKNANNELVIGDINCSQAGHAWVGGTCKDNSGNAVFDVASNAECLANGYRVEGAFCRDASGNDVGGDPDCSNPGNRLVDPFTDSIACLIAFDQYDRINFLETIGISIPSVTDLFTKNIKEKILTIIKAAFVMYVLCQFVDQIPSITSQLIGGSALPGSNLSATGMMKSVAGFADGVRERITRGGFALGKSSYNTVKDTANKENEEENSEAKDSSQGDGKTSAGKDDNSGSNNAENESSQESSGESSGEQENKN
jgi:hypothetical protein